MLCRDISVPLHIPADGLRGHLAADPFMAEVLQRLKADGRTDVFQAWLYTTHVLWG